MSADPLAGANVVYPGPPRMHASRTLIDGVRCVDVVEDLSACGPWRPLAEVTKAIELVDCRHCLELLAKDAIARAKNLNEEEPSHPMWPADVEWSGARHGTSGPPIRHHGMPGAALDIYTIEMSKGEVTRAAKETVWRLGGKLCMRCLEPRVDTDLQAFCSCTTCNRQGWLCPKCAHHPLRCWEHT